MSFLSSYVKNNIVIEIARVDPYTIFNPGYASQFIDAPDDVTPGYVYANNTFTKPTELQQSLPSTPTEAQIEQEHKNKNKAQAIQLLNVTDWVEVPSVSNTSKQIYLTNYTDFVAYRDELRIIAVRPTANVTWPEMPTEQWSQ